MSYTILKPQNPLLRMPSKSLTKAELRLNKTQELIEIMLDFVYGTNNKSQNRDRSHSMTVGLSANQIGIAKSISIVDLAIGRNNISDIHVLINPQIMWKSKSCIARVEGCVNLPHIWGEVKRAHKIRVKALDRSGNEINLTLSGWSAILLQHEIDHLNGYLFIDHLPDPKKAHLVEDNDYLLYKRSKKAWKKFVDVSGLVRT